MSYLPMSDGNAELGGGKPIPDGTKVLAAPYEAKWDDFNGEYYINIAWTVLAPDEFKNRKVFQKLKTETEDKKEKALTMLAAIDANAGGKIAATGVKPTDQILQSLINKPMVLKLGVWELDDGSKSGNWVMAVQPKTGGTPAPEPEPAPKSGPVENLGDDIPF